MVCCLCCQSHHLQMRGQDVVRKEWHEISTCFICLSVLVMLSSLLLALLADNAAVDPLSSPQHLLVQWAAVSPEAPPVDPCLPAEVNRSDLIRHYNQQLPALEEKDAALRKKCDVLEDRLNTMPPELSPMQIPVWNQLAKEMQVCLCQQFHLKLNMTTGLFCCNRQHPIKMQLMSIPLPIW